jgi:Ca-activated chloride channel homolog
MSSRAPLCVLAALCLLISTPALADPGDSWERRGLAWERAVTRDADLSELAATGISTSHDPGQGALHATVGEKTWALPLLHTDVDAEISATVVDVQLTQTFANPFDQTIEALYLFPLPEDAAVDDMWMQVGDQFVMAEIHRTKEAEQIYEEAKDEGKTAALLQQWRPNTFTQHVANIPPGGRVDVAIHLVQPLKYRDGGYEWVFPTVVGPRFTPPSGTGDRDEDGAAFIAAMDGPVTEGPSGQSLDLFAWIDAGVPIREISSPSHDIVIDRDDPTTADVGLAQDDRRPNKDFTLRWQVAGGTPELALLAHRDPSVDADGYFLLALQPPDPGALSDLEIQPKEMIFVVDTSGSMTGFPMDAARDVMRHAIDGMHPEDSFWILRFGDRVSSMATAPLENTIAGRARGEAFVDTFTGGGGTYMIPGVLGALDLPRDAHRSREVFLVTDGEIGNDREVMTVAEQHLGRARLHTLGIGSSPNRALLEGIARVGRGQPDFIRPDGDTEQAVEDFYNRIRSPLLKDVLIDFDGVRTHDLTPDPVADLYAGQPIVLLGRYRQGGVGTVRVSGELRGETVEYEWEIELPAIERSHAAVASLWARRNVEELEFAQLDGDQDAIVEEIVALCLDHRIVSRHTSFVAVAQKRVPGVDGPAVPVRVPRDLPDMVDYVGVFGRVPGRASGGGSGSSGGLLGSQMGSQHGLGGLGTSGVGYGGGGSGHGSGVMGRKSSAGYGRGSGFYGKKSSMPSVSGSPMILGAIDKSVIDRVVKQHVPAIRYEYEKGLKASPGLQGKVKIEFVIGADGNVASASVKSSTLGDAAVEQGIARRFHRMKFPAPTGGGQVVVSYPFVFSSDGVPPKTDAELAPDTTPVMRIELVTPLYDPDPVLADLERRLKRVERGWIDAASGSPLFGGSWLVMLEISESGRVQHVQLVEDDLQLSALSEQLLYEALTWRLPSLEGGPLSELFTPEVPMADGDPEPPLVVRVEFARE